MLGIKGWDHGRWVFRHKGHQHLQHIMKIFVLGKRSRQEWLESRKLNFIKIHSINPRDYEYKDTEQLITKINSFKCTLPKDHFNTLKLIFSLTSCIVERKLRMACSSSSFTPLPIMISCLRNSSMYALRLTTSFSLGRGPSDYPRGSKFQYLIFKYIYRIIMELQNISIRHTILTVDKMMALHACTIKSRLTEPFWIYATLVPGIDNPVVVLEGVHGLENSWNTPHWSIDLGVWQELSSQIGVEAHLDTHRRVYP